MMLMDELQKSYGKLRGEEGFALLASLKACSKRKDLQEGTRLHALIRERGSLRSDPHLATALISMYAKCGFVGMAQRLHDELPMQTVDSWNALISGYSQRGQDRSALDRFASMQSHGFLPDEVTLICALKACGNMGSVVDGERVHEQILHRSLLGSRKNAKLGTALMDMYVKCGLLRRAQEVHEQLRVRDSFSWCVLIAGFARSGLPHKALACFEQMRAEGLSPDAVVLACVLKACGSLGSIDIGARIHDAIAREGLLGKDVVLGTALVDMYAKCGSVSTARRVHDGLRARSVVSWSALIAGYAQQRKGQEALHSFEEMRREGHAPDSIALISVLAACGSTGNIDVGRRIHGEIADRGLLDGDVGLLGTALVDMYTQCGFLARARKAHDRLPVRTTASWNALLAGFAQHGQHREAAECFERMRGEGLSPDAITFTCMSKVCAGAGSIDKGMEIHGEAAAGGLLKEDAELGNALVDMYARFGMLAKAEELHRQSRVQTIASWNALIAGFARQGRAREALACFERMQRKGIAPDEASLTCILKVCSSTGAIERGERIHEEIARRGFSPKNAMLGTALMDMYLKCRMAGRAQEVHDQLAVRDVVSWSALIAGYAQQGQGRKALECFAAMQSEGVRADLITFLSILNACNRTGLSAEATAYYCDMSSNHGIVPGILHHIRMVSIFACVGSLDQAVSIILTSPSSRFPPLWLSLLGGCRRWGHLVLGRSAFDQLMQLDKSSSASGMREDATKIEEAMMVLDASVSKYMFVREAWKRMRAKIEALKLLKLVLKRSN